MYRVPWFHVTCVHHVFLMCMAGSLEFGFGYGETARLQITLKPISYFLFYFFEPQVLAKRVWLYYARSQK